LQDDLINLAAFSGRCRVAVADGELQLSAELKRARKAYTLRYKNPHQFRARPSQPMPPISLDKGHSKPIIVAKSGSGGPATNNAITKETQGQGKASSSKRGQAAKPDAKHVLKHANANANGGKKAGCGKRASKEGRPNEPQESQAKQTGRSMRVAPMEDVASGRTDTTWLTEKPAHNAPRIYVEHADDSRSGGPHAPLQATISLRTLRILHRLVASCHRVELILHPAAPNPPHAMRSLVVPIASRCSSLDSGFDFVHGGSDPSTIARTCAPLVWAMFQGSQTSERLVGLLVCATI
jgi:hypothetical protein